MSALGQKRTHAPQQKRLLFDHIVGASEHRGWHRNAKRFSRLEIDYQLVLSRRLHRQVGWLLALEDGIDIFGRAPERIQQINPMGHSAVRDERAFVTPTPVMLG